MKCKYLFILLSLIFFFLTYSCKEEIEEQIPSIKFNPQIVYDSIKDLDGNLYKTVKIGSQYWMAENLRLTHYRNGDPVIEVLDNSQWKGTNTGAYCSYENDFKKISVYGYLYNLDAITDSRNIAPIGWHIPSDYEWQVLMAYAGGENQAGPNLSESGSTHWILYNGIEGTNKFGFTALPSGARDENGSYIGLRESGCWWSKSKNEGLPDYQWMAEILNVNWCFTAAYFQKMGFSIRCVKDYLLSFTTKEVTEITETTAISGGIIIPNGDTKITSRGVCLSVKQNPTVGAYYITYDGAGEGSYISYIKGLKKKTKYYIRAYAIHPAEIEYGPELIFTTL